MKKENYKTRLWLTALTALSIGALFGSCNDEFDEVLGICPEVESTNPEHEAIGIQLDNAITVTFNEDMNPATILPGVFSLRVNNASTSGRIDTSEELGDQISGDLTFEEGTNKMSFKPNAALLPNTTYTGRVEPVVKDMVGNALQTAYVWTFTTGVSPTVISTNPANLATGTPLDQMITATFSTAMDSLTITGATYKLMAGTTPVSGEVVYSGSSASFNPTNDLLAGTKYTGVVTIEAKNKDGIPLAIAYNWTFDTGTAPTVMAIDPKDLETGVPANKTIKVTFSELMDPGTITNSSFTVKTGTLPVAGTVTYSDSSAVFTPKAGLISNTIYSVSISKSVKSPAGVPMANDFASKFTTGNFSIPEVRTTDPADKATGVALNKAILATFSEAMDPASLTGTTFTLKQGNTAVAGTLSYSENKATFTPAKPLSGNLVYTGTITTGAKNAAGTGLANNFVWTFTTAANVAPTVLSTDPADKTTNVAHDKAATATFSEAMDPATLTGTTFTLKQGNTPVAGKVTYTGTKATFTPTNPLSGNLVYTGTITTGAKNAAGTGLANNFFWTFTTAANVAPTVISTDPVDKATDIELDKVARATFSEAMDPASLTATTFTVKQGNTAVAGNVSYSGITAIFTPNLPLLPNLVYTGTITTGAKNVKGTNLEKNHVWNFTTVAPIAPMVVSTDPLNNATNVARNKVVKASFTIPMDPASINDLTFTLQQGGNNVAGTVSYSGTTASFTPASLLMANLSYTATVTTGAKSVEGTGLESDYEWNFRIENPISPYFVDLKSADRFGIFAATGISNNAGFSKISDLDVGITPGARSSVTGFPPAIIENGAIFASDDVSPAGVAAMLNQTKLDLTAAYLFAEGATIPAPATVAGDQGGKTLAPGIYKSNSTLLIQAGDLTLDAQGDPNAVWIFQIASSFTTVGGAGGNIILSGGAQAKNIFWQVGSSATIGDNTKFKGNVLAFTSITMNSGATIVGRMLVLNGAVVMTNTNIIERP